MWSDLPIETQVKKRLDAECGQQAGSHWAAYLQTRKDLEASIFPYIATREPNLSDHGVDHIAHVMKNASALFGLQKGGSGSPRPSPIKDLTAKELLLLLLACLLHDVGNIAGRQNHNQTGSEVWRLSGQSSYDLWSAQDRRTILAVCRAHTGRTETGSSDTLEPLAVQSHYFLGENVRAAEIAAIVRFADELAEGPMRTSNYLLSKRLYSKESLPYHIYATSTDIVIDFGGKRIAINYDIDIKNFVGRKPKPKQQFEAFMQLVYHRILKLEHERVFARHYAPDFIPFRETSISMHFSREGNSIAPVLRPIVLNDFNARGDDFNIIYKLESSYKIPSLADSIFPGR